MIRPLPVVQLLPCRCWSCERIIDLSEDVQRCVTGDSGQREKAAVERSRQSKCLAIVPSSSQHGTATARQPQLLLRVAQSVSVNCFWPWWAQQLLLCVRVWGARKRSLYQPAFKHLQEMRKAITHWRGGKRPFARHRNVCGYSPQARQLCVT
jgi:hypothetical protein